jgi:hypothetical protein
MQSNQPNEEAVYVTKAQASFTELLAQREAIILDLDNLHYYTLNGTAIFLWNQLRSRTAQTAAALTRTLATAFNLNTVQAERDVAGFLDSLRGFDLIETSNASASPTTLPLEPAAVFAYEKPQLRLSNSLTQVVLSGSSTIATAAIATG